MVVGGSRPEKDESITFDWGMAMGPNGVSDLSGLDVLKLKTNGQSAQMIPPCGL